MFHCVVTMGNKKRNISFLHNKVSHKPRSAYHRGESVDDQIGRKARDEEPDGRRQPSLLLMPGKTTEVVSKLMFSFACAKKNEVDFKRM